MTADGKRDIGGGDKVTDDQLVPVTGARKGMSVENALLAELRRPMPEDFGQGEADKESLFGCVSVWRKMKTSNRKCQEAFDKLEKRGVVQCLGASQPKVSLIVLLYLSKFDCAAILGIQENSQAAIASALGITKQSFHERCWRTARAMNLDYVPLNRGHRLQRNHRERPFKINPVPLLAERCKREITSGRMKREDVTGQLKTSQSGSIQNQPL